jgi:membrane-associated protease RseP (regulator of RpoE activity)
MDMIFWYLLALALMVLWSLAVSAAWGRWKGQLEKRNIHCMGPFVMWKTQKGRELIERVANTRQRIVGAYGRLSVGITGVSMVTMTMLLFFSAYLVIDRARDLDLEPHMLLGLPGLNPMIPLWYGIFALVIAMAVHEFSHGLLTVLAKVKVLSLGVMFFIFPMGAFVEPDEEAIKGIEKRKRVRMYASGPASNIIVAGMFSLLFSVVLMSSVQPAVLGVGITNVGDGSAADIAGLRPGLVMVSFNNTTLETQSDFSEAIALTRANQTVEIMAVDPATGVAVPYYANLTDKALALKNPKPGDHGKGYLGINSMTVSDSYFHPIGESSNLTEFAVSLSTYVTLPLNRLSPVDGAVMDFYEVNGLWSFLPEGHFWVLANACYWIFWLNLMVGLSNALPAVPLDGGYIFKDWLDSFLGRLERYAGDGNLERRTAIVDRVAVALAFLILFLIIWQVIGPKIL